MVPPLSCLKTSHHAVDLTPRLLRENPKNPAKTGVTKKIAAGTGVLTGDGLKLNSQLLTSPFWLVKLKTNSVGSKPFPARMPVPIKLR